MPNDHWVRYQKWSVIWYSEKKRKYVRKRFREDIGAAIKFYAEHLDRKHITLHADNHGYPPPLRITEHPHAEWKVVTRKGKKYKRKIITIVNLMEEYNAKGIWWCGYCIQLRRFVFTETEEGPLMSCPVCGSNHRINRAYNPQAAVIDMHKRQRRTNASRRRRRR